MKERNRVSQHNDALDIISNGKPIWGSKNKKKHITWPVINIVLRILMVSTEYPPMTGGIGRYTFNLTKALIKSGQEVFVVCNEKGNGDYKGLSPTNKDSSELLSKLVNDVKPDVVHIQFEPGLYGMSLNPFLSKKGKTSIDLFYDTCKIPIITTFHSLYTFREWIAQVTL
ncbi:MAG: glycosyltransferase, partial [Thermoproteota archaeon]|nr:glycosyltransferase [Thermoproteota archaeon]